MAAWTLTSWLRVFHWNNSFFMPTYFSTSVFSSWIWLLYQRVFFFFFTLEKNDDGMPAWQASGCLFKARVLVSFSTSHSYITLECNVPSDTAPNYTFLPRLLRSFFWPCCKSKEGKKKKKRKKRKKNGPPSRTAFYTRLISMLGCLNCLLEGWREIEQYPLALETSPIASHLFLCRVRTDLGTTPLRKLSPGRPGLGRSGQIN